MMALGGYALLRPLWLLGLPVLAALVFAGRRGGRLGDWRRAIDPALLEAMLARGAAVPGRPARGLAPGAVMALVLLALSGPAVQRAGAERFRNLDALLLLIDLSGDTARGLPLQQMKSAAHLLLERAGARQAGVIVFGGDAYLASGLTTDANATDAVLFALDGDTVPDPGARPERALAMARRILREAAIARADVVLVSGGGGIAAAAMREAVLLARDGHAVSTLAAGAGQGALAALAAAGQGVAAAAASPGPVLEAAGGRAIARLGDSALSGLVWQDLGRWLLALAALPLLTLFRRRLA